MWSAEKELQLLDILNGERNIKRYIYDYIIVLQRQRYFLMVVIVNNALKTHDILSLWCFYLTISFW